MMGSRGKRDRKQKTVDQPMQIPFLINQLTFGHETVIPDSIIVLLFAGNARRLC
jgi:hypothetical protein